ncbi:phosphate ABC transporter permease PstA [Arthrobacter sp. E918]|uniref:Phosphate transport system permease protein PstA n=1 Tax=Arthrobacter mobilis TaxID=2724944 RepID=A0A7X6K6B9_9MICC|nr:phosphate ABC transporter permease PstA [Arthrobacter mobilis]
MTTTTPPAPAPVKRSTLTKNQLPGWAMWAVLAGSLILGAALSSLIGFHIATWALFSALIYVAAGYFVTLSVEGARKAKDRFATNLVYAAFIVALLPLVSVIVTVLAKGIPGLTPHLLYYSMNGMTGTVDNETVANGTPVIGGVYHGIVGTLLITTWATIISVPIGLLTAVYLVEYSKGGTLARAITFFVDVMTGIPSIVAGLFAAAFFGLVFGPGTRTGFVAAVALSVLMIPVVVRSTEEMLKIVPNELREASYALGVRKWRTILKVVVPTAISGIASGVTLAIARVIGETAPLLVTAGFVNSINWNVFGGWMATLPTFIYRQLMNPTSPTNTDPSAQRAWAAALILIIFVMLLNLVARLIARIFAPKSGR